MKSDLLRRSTFEVVGTFGIVFPPVALGASGQLPGGASGLFCAALISALPVTAMIYTFGASTGAHFNPAVSIALAIRRRFAVVDLLPYILSQLLGGVLAAVISRLIFGVTSGTHVPTVGAGTAILAEFIFTFLLMTVIMGAAVDHRANRSFAGVAIGCIVMVDVLIGGPITGGSMNPARSFGPALVNGGAALSSWWIYIVGPISGAIAAAGLYDLLFPSSATLIE